MAINFFVPPELVRSIFEHLTAYRSELHALTLSSKVFYWEAMPLLYRSMTAQGVAQIKFLTTLRDNPQLASLVRVYHIPTHDISHGTLGWPLILHCIKRMINLKELVYINLFAKFENPFLQVGEGERMPFQLERFVWAVEGRHRQDGVIQFLSTQNRLKYLQLSCQLGQHMPSDIVPDLHTLDGDVDLICEALPGRSISKLYWREYPWRVHRPWSYFNILLHASQLEELSEIRGLSVSVGILGRLSSTQLQNGLHGLRNVEILEICSSEIISDINNIAKKFPCLKRLIIRLDASKVPSPSSPVGDESSLSKEISREEIVSLFNKGSPLVCVDIWAGGPLYQRWVDKAPLPGLIMIPADRTLELVT